MCRSYLKCFKDINLVYFSWNKIEKLAHIGLNGLKIELELLHCIMVHQIRILNFLNINILVN